MKENKSRANNLIPRMLVALAATGGLSVLCGVTALAAAPISGSPPDLPTVIGNIRLWAIGILAALATLFLTVGGVRYLIAGGNPRAVEEAKASIRNALIGYALAALAPLIFGILQKVVG